jgi:hypothetical protein
MPIRRVSVVHDHQTVADQRGRQHLAVDLLLPDLLAAGVERVDRALSPATAVTAVGAGAGRQVQIGLRLPARLTGCAIERQHGAAVRRHINRIARRHRRHHVRATLAHVGLPGLLDRQRRGNRLQLRGRMLVFLAEQRAACQQAEAGAGNDRAGGGYAKQ